MYLVVSGLGVLGRQRPYAHDRGLRPCGANARNNLRSHSLAMRLPACGPAHYTDRRLEIGGVCGHREVGRVTPCAEGRGLETPRPPGARQEMVVMDGSRHAAEHEPAFTPPGCPRYQGRHKPWRRADPSLRPSLPKTVRHPTDAAEMRQFSGKRTTLESSPAPSRGNHIGHCGPSCRQDPRSAIRHRDQPPKQNQNPVRHLLSLRASVGSCGQFQNPSNTRNTLCPGNPRG
jgi:hypothetical protein